MQISLDRVREEPFTWQERLAIPADRLASSDLAELGQISIEGRVEFFDPDFHLRIRYGYRQQLVCCRCLKVIDKEMEGEIDSLVEVGTSPEATGEIKLDSGDLGWLRIESEELDTETILMDELQLNIPMKPLCQSDCKGLCGGCGADLNQGDCGCDRVSIDPRWQALAALKAKSEKND